MKIWSGWKDRLAPIDYVTVSDSFHCRSCGSTNGSLVLDLGLQPLANNLLTRADLDKPEPKFPLRVAVCERCWLLQITDIVPPVTLFSEYLYFSSFSDALLRHAAEAANRYVKEFSLSTDSFVIEIASNDGYLLKNFTAASIPCLGIEPAANIAKVAREKASEQSHASSAPRRHVTWPQATAKRT